MSLFKKLKDGDGDVTQYILAGYLIISLILLAVFVWLFTSAMHHPK